MEANLKRIVDIGSNDAQRVIPVPSEPDLTLLLKHDERHVRRKVFDLRNAGRVLLDLPEPTVLLDGQALVLEDGNRVVVKAAEEELYDVIAKDSLHLTELAWHIGNRHLAAEISPDRIRILRDHVIKDMLERLGARVDDVVAPFAPVRGAYSGHSHSHDSHNHL